MKSSLFMNFSVDKENKKIKVEREFAAPLETVWAAWTQSEILDKWWAPKPWKVKTKYQNFEEGGKWLYAMVGPEGEEHWSFASYKTIVPQKSYTAGDGFCDSDGNINTTLPQSTWNNQFKAQDNHTMVSIEITFNKLEDLEGIVSMGFEEGFKMGMGNLDELLG